MIQPDWTNSKTGQLELWKNPLLPMNKRLEIADDVIANQRSEINSIQQRMLPKHHDQWIIEFNESVFVVFDPTTDGSDIIGATRTSSGWTAAWESIPLTYASEELVENWPVVAPETVASVYGRSGVGPYRAICYGKDKVLAPRWLGDKLTIIDPTVT